MIEGFVWLEIKLSIGPITFYLLPYTWWDLLDP